MTKTERESKQAKRALEEARKRHIEKVANIKKCQQKKRGVVD